MIYLNPFEKIELKKNSFTKKELIVYNILQKNPDLILRGSLSSLSEDYNVSQPTITRFCQKIGYTGFNDFKYDVFRYEKQGSHDVKNNSTTIDEYCNLLHILDESIHTKQLNKFAKDIIKAKTIYICGYHKSSLPAKMLQYNLFKIHKVSIFISIDEAHDLDQILTPDYMLILITNNGNLLKRFHFKDLKSKNNFNLSIITMNDKISIKKYCNNYIWLPSSSNQNLKHYLENQIVFFIYIDILTSTLTKLI